MRENPGRDERLTSLDVFRGLDMFFIMGGGLLVRRLCVLVGWGDDCPLARQFVHVAWHGLHFEDMIFPIFLFIAGVSFPYSMAKQLARGRSRWAIVHKNVVRAVMLFVLGLVYGGQIFGPDWSKIVWGSVLGRIGVSWFFASVLFLFVGWRGRLVILVSVLLGYWVLLLFVIAPDASTVVVPNVLLPYEGATFAPSTNLAGYLDRMLMPGTLTVPGVISNQGLLSTVPAVMTALLGMMTGEFVKGTGAAFTGGVRALRLGGVGLGLACAGCLVSFGFGRWSMPFNKILWSSSFTLTVGGIAVLAFAVLHYVIDVRRWVTWAMPFEVIGLNSITIYIIQRIVPVDSVVSFFIGKFAVAMPMEWFSVLSSVGYVTLCWSFLYFLYRRKIFLKV